MKKYLMSAMGSVLLRDSSRGSETSSISITWTSVCIPRSSTVSKGPSVLVFFDAGMSSSVPSIVSEGDDPLAGPIGHLQVGAKPDASVRSKSRSGGSDEGISESVEVAVVAPL